MNSPVKNWREIKKISQQLGRVGKVVTWTKVFVAPTGFEHEVPYLVAIVEFLDGQRTSVQVVDCLEEQIIEGMEVITVVRRIGKPSGEDVINYGIKVVPTQKEPS